MLFALSLIGGEVGQAAAATTPTSIDQVLSSPDYRPEHADVLRLYLAFFDRQPDAAGANYWIAQFDSGTTLDDLAWSFSASTEFVTTYGASVSDRQFLTIVYGNVLGRTPDAGGLDYWDGQLREGLSRHGAVRWIAANEEFKNAYPFAPIADPSRPSGWATGTTVSWFDHWWTIETLSATPDPRSQAAQNVALHIRVRNPLPDASYALPTSWVSLKDRSGNRYIASKTTDVVADRSTSRVDVAAEGARDYVWNFVVPRAVNIDDLAVEIGTTPNRSVVVSRTEASAPGGHGEVALGTKAWDGPYSWNSARLTATGAFASWTSGVYEDGSARPAIGYPGDRQANEGQLFVHIDFDMTEYSSSPVIGININEFRIDADGVKYECADDAPLGLNAASASFSITCGVPESANLLTLEIGTDPCVGGCKEWEWTSSVELVS